MRDIVIQKSLTGIDWGQCKRDLAGDSFDNGRSALALQLAFEASPHVAIARDAEDRVVGMGRLLSDGVSNAYLVDLWVRSSHRRRGIGACLVQVLCDAVPGQHIGLQTDDQMSFYLALGFREQPSFLSRITGQWLQNQANRP